MQGLDRTKVPSIRNLDSIRIPEYKEYTLSNGLPVYALNIGTQDVIKLELVFRAGRTVEHKKVVSRATQDMLKEGTKSYKNFEISEKVDFYGTYIGTQFNLDANTIGFHCLKKYFKDILPYLSSILFEPVFPEEELQAWKHNARQKLAVDLERSDVLAYRKLTEQIFGSEHPYGYNSTVDLFNQLSREDLIRHHKEQYIKENCQIFITGNVDDSCIQLLESFFSSAMPSGNRLDVSFPEIDLEPQKLIVPAPSDVQTSVRLGYRLFNKGHKDYNGLYVLNNLFGGYFGSRLMMNIREEKGLTYNIYSSIDSFMHDGYFYIGSETSSENVEELIDEIFKEMDILKTELVPEDELLMLRNYIIGNMMTMVDGAFNAGEVLRSYLADGLSFDLFGELLEKVKTISAEELRELARTYFDQERLHQIIVGK